VKGLCVSGSDVASTLAPLGPGRRAPQRPKHQDGLKEQADEAGGICVQSEGRRTRHELRDVPREDDHEEGRDYPAHRRTPARWSDYQGGTEHKLDYSGNRHHRLGEGHPRWNLGEEGLRIGEVTESSAEQDYTQSQATERSQHSPSMARSVR